MSPNALKEQSNALTFGVMRRFKSRSTMIMPRTAIVIETYPSVEKASPNLALKMGRASKVDSLEMPIGI